MSARWLRHLWPCIALRDTIQILTTMYSEAQRMQDYLKGLGPDGDD